MNASPAYDAVVVGSGPNGLAAAITLAREGRSVLVLEGSTFVGGGLRTEEATLPGFVHDICSAIHPLALASPFFRSLPLAQHGLRFIHAPAPLAHPLEGGKSVLMSRSIDEMADALGRDYRAYASLLRPFVESWQDFMQETLVPMLHVPRHPVLLARFGLNAFRSAQSLAVQRFHEPATRALFAGHSAHSFVRLDATATASFGMMLALLGHAVGWPMIEGGSSRLADALAAHLRSLGGVITTGVMVKSLNELPSHRVLFLDVSPRQFGALAGSALPESYRRRLQRFRYGPGAFKVDWALSAPIPWKSSDCAKAGTVHVGGTLEEIATAEAAAWNGHVPDRPFLLLSQQSLFDPTRAPAGKHTAWAYCHVPNGATTDMTERMEAQIERFAPGFRDVILARAARSPRILEDENPNFVGGDISGGANHLTQLVARPFLQGRPYTTPIKGVYLCSSSTAPGGGVHGMCGFNAAKAALRHGF